MHFENAQNLYDYLKNRQYEKEDYLLLGFIVYLTLLNLLFWSIGTLVVPEYNNYSHSGIYLESIIFVSVQSFIQVFIFRIEKKTLFS